MEVTGAFARVLVISIIITGAATQTIGLTTGATTGLTSVGAATQTTGLTTDSTTGLISVATMPVTTGILVSVQPTTASYDTATMQTGFTEKTTERITEQTAEPATRSSAEPATRPTAEPATGTAQANSTEGPTDSVATTGKPGTTATAAFKQFQFEMRILEIDGEAANFTSAYEDNTSPEYEDLSEDICLAVDAVILSSDYKSDLLACEVTGFKSGSIVASYDVHLAEKTEATAEIITKLFVTAFTDSSNPVVAKLVVDTESIQVTLKEPEKTKLSTGAIVGIAVGGFVGLILLIVVLALLVKCCTGSSSKVTNVEGGELRPTSRQGEEEVKGHDNAASTAH